MPTHQIGIQVPVWEELTKLREALGGQFGGAPGTFSYGAVISMLVSLWDHCAEHGSLPPTGQLREWLDRHPKRGRKPGTKNKPYVDPEAGLPNIDELVRRNRERKDPQMD